MRYVEEEVTRVLAQGASTTVVGSKMYLYVSILFLTRRRVLTPRAQGGRLVSERKMVSDIYVFDLETFHWERLPQSSEDDIPQARYFHSADTCMPLSFTLE